MHRIRYIVRQVLTSVAILMLIGMAPAPVLADDAANPTPAPTDSAGTSQQQSSQQTNQQQPTQPTQKPAFDPSDPANGPVGADAHLFHYNSGTGLWENDYYTFDPVTKARSPKVPLEYTCNPDTHKWDTKIWEYDAPNDTYVQVPVSLDVVPDGAIKHDCPVPPPAPQTTAPTNESDGSQNSQSPSSGSGSSQTDKTSTNVGNTIQSDAGSGAATVTDNHGVGSVGTGNATASANVINQLQSQSSLSGSGVATFTANIQGNVQGDIVIDPATLAQPAGTDPSVLNNATINTSTDGTTNNNITVNAASGAATVTDNHNVGSVTTGNATAIADVINMINSIVAANQSFVGTINIYGDYSGNILLPANSLNALLASAGPDSAVNSNSVTTDSNYSINNNVGMNAASGTASVADNQGVGSVTTGNAMTNLTILNLTGKQVVTANCLLVFVNVLGHWVGLIMDAPAGATAAALGGGVSSSATLASSSAVNSTENYSINNNITANATTGNATVNDNHQVGTVGTGNAAASVSIANLVSSNFSIANWFGVLFINVFGTWHGNIAVKQSPVIAPITSGSALPAGMGAGGTVDQPMKAFAFVPTGSAMGNAGTSGPGVGSNSGMTMAPLLTTDVSSNSGGSGSLVQVANAVLGAAHEATTKPSIDVKKDAAQGFNYWTVILIATGSAGLGFVAVEHVRSSLRSRYINK